MTSRYKIVCGSVIAFRDTRPEAVISARVQAEKHKQKARVFDTGNNDALTYEVEPRDKPIQ